jgi:transposase-like protein
VERWQASDLTAKEFAAEIGVNPRTLSHWKWMLGRGGSGSERRRSKPNTRTATSPEVVSFTELAIEPAETRASSIEIVLDARRVVRVDSGFEAASLARVLDVLEARS